METRPSGAFAKEFRALFAAGSTSGMTDAQLLACFAAGGGESAELAFAALIQRHGGMVLGVCRGILRDAHDAQDACQATFLILVAKAGSLWVDDSLGPWLHRVACRVARRARTQAIRRQAFAKELSEAAKSPAPAPGECERIAELHEEIDRLPGPLRAPLVLCDLEGFTYAEASRQLGWSTGTVKGRLARARERLRRRLGRPDLDLSPAALGLTPRLARHTAALAARFAAGSPDPASAALVLAQGVLRMMTLAKWKLAAMAALAALALVGVSAARTPATPGQGAAAAPPVADAVPRPGKGEQVVAPRGMTVQAGRGAILMYLLDEQGGGIVDPAARGRVAPLGLLGGPPRRSPEGPWKEAEVEVRWAVIVGVLDHWLVRELGAKSRGVEPSAFRPEYRRAEVERQVRGPDGAWSNWAGLDRRSNRRVLDNLPEYHEEFTPEAVRPPALVDPLPFRKKANWSGVDPEVLLKLSAAQGPVATMIAGDGKLGAGMSGAARQSPELPPVVAVRSLDFTVEPGKTYRYRVRVVCREPEKAAGWDEVFGPWSEPTPEVAVP